MKRMLIYLVLVVFGICQAEVPKLLTERAFTSASLAEAANHFIVIGEPATFKELEAFIAEDSAHTNYLFNRGYSVDERIAWIFRIIYEPKESSPMLVPKSGVVVAGTTMPLRAPRFGVLGIPENSMPAEKWPLFPLALSGSTYIVLKERYTSEGVPETIEHYMAYCRDNGTFRRTTVQVPTREQALKDAADLRQSASWKAIKWMDDSNFSFPLGEQWTWAAIQNQAKAIPDQPAYARHSTPHLPNLSLR